MGAVGGAREPGMDALKTLDLSDSLTQVVVAFVVIAGCTLDSSSKMLTVRGSRTDWAARRGP